MVSLESPPFVPTAQKAATNPAPAQEAPPNDQNPEEEKKAEWAWSSPLEHEAVELKLWDQDDTIKQLKTNNDHQENN